MCKGLLSREMYDYLTQHSVEIARKKEMLIKELFVEETQESISFNEFFNEYLDNIDNYLSTTRVGKGGSNTCPFVIIGSIVDVHDFDYNEDLQYHIVLPYEKRQETNIDCASCLSPLGKSLLFKRLNEPVNIQVPAGELHYIINKITVPDIKAVTASKLSNG
ncbi:MAG TPA: GreA/GreB family elongation factor [Pseudobacteroides sp.]|nr:GreA/GreB family elongation factor [Pseudobacteroides sp.]